MALTLLSPMDPAIQDIFRHFPLYRVKIPRNLWVW